MPPGRPDPRRDRRRARRQDHLREDERRREPGDARRRTASPASRPSTSTRTARSSSRSSAPGPRPRCSRSSPTSSPEAPSSSPGDPAGGLQSLRELRSSGSGTRGPAVAQIIRSAPTRIDLLRRRCCSDVPSGRSASSASGADAYDERVELAVRAFQQQRGLTVDGVVGPLTFRRLDEARWRLGDRILTHLPGNLMAGDDVYALQGRLLDLGFQVGRARRLLRPRDRGRRARVPAQLRHPARRHLRPGHPQGARPGSPRWSRAAPPTRCAPRSGSARPAPTSAARSW